MQRSGILARVEALVGIHIASSNSLLYLATPVTRVMIDLFKIITMNASSGTPSHCACKPYIEARSDPKRG
jgi:hypothetical protein